MRGFGLIFTVLLLSLAGCRGCQAEEADRFSDCGECLHVTTGEVCTVRGTMQNSCMAICTGARILCKGPCPCGAEK